MLKLMLESAAQIPEGFEKAYEEKNGKFYLKLDEDVVPKKDLGEFRDNNIQLMKEKDALAKQLQKFDGVNLEEYQEALKLKQAAAEKKLLEQGDVEKLVQTRTERMRSDFDGQTQALNAKIQGLEEERNGLSQQLSSVLIDSQIQAAVNEVGRPREGAMQDIMNRGRSLFKLQDGEPVPVGNDGKPIYGKDGKAPMTFVEWATGLQETAGFLFESATGGGSQGNRSSTGGAQSTKVIAPNDPVAFGDNLESIAKGETTVAVQ